MKIAIVIALVVAVGALFVAYFKGFMGKPVRGVLRVPQGRNRVPVVVQDDAVLRPFRFGQAFEAKATSQGQALAISLGGATIGYADEASAYVRVLLGLAERHKGLVVSTVVTSLDENRRPVVNLLLPNDKWFARAMKAGKDDG